jgi:hypothetical protein
LVEPGFTDAKMPGCGRCINYPITEIGENTEDKNGRQAMNDLFLFKSGASLKAGAPYDQNDWRPALPEGRSPPRKRGLSVGLRYAPASSKAAFTRESNGMSGATREFHF